MQEGYWGAAVLDLPNYRYDLFLYPCPPGYCKCSQNTSLGPSSCAFTYTNSDPDAQCACDRQGNYFAIGIITLTFIHYYNAGILCGECQDGKGVSVLLNDCVYCPNARGLLILGLSKFNDRALIIILLFKVYQIPNLRGTL